MDSSPMGGSVFDDFGDSDAYSPAPKVKAKAPAKKAAAPKTAAKKAAAKPKATTKVSAQKRSVPISDDEADGIDGAADSSFSNTPPSAKKQKKAPAPKKGGGIPFQELENESMALDGASDPKSSKEVSASDRYQQLSHLEHIIKRPDTYIGSIEKTEQQMWTFNSQTNEMEFRKVNYVPGLYKIFDEVLVNAADNKQNDASMSFIKVVINRELGEISVENNGRGIPVEIHTKQKIYIPEMIFGHLLTSSNYNDEEAKTTGGRNGFGAKLCNIFSTEFTVETQDSKNGKRYKQTWTDNMGNMGKPKITSNKTSDFTRVTFKPDFAKFRMPDGIDDDFESLVKRRVYDMAGTVKGVKVYLNGEHIKLDFKKYIEMHTRAINKERGLNDGDAPVKDVIAIDSDKSHDRWEVGFAVSDGAFQQVSFVNSIATTSGGTHVNYIADQICLKLQETIKRRNSKGAALKLNQIRNHIFIFVNCLITNPSFTSQTKEQLTTRQSQFGSKCVLTDAFLAKVAKSEAVANILHFAEKKADQALAKSDGSRRSRINNPKLVDANLAGTKRGHECTLILTEGDSASSLAIAGRAALDPDRIGVFPLRGKVLNVRDASIDQISKNAEIQNIKQFIGLKHKQHYEDTKGLRYGHLMVMADQDHDGSHIKGLLMNFFQVSFPSLLRMPDFFREFSTPIVKVWKGSPSPLTATAVRSFFTLTDYSEWETSHQHELKKWEKKYFKGLGTNKNEDAQIYFSNLDEHLKEFHPMQPHEEKLFELAFSKKMADDRKRWLAQFVPGTSLDPSLRKVSYDEFVNKELILFSMADNIRSIPSIVDGLKPGQRKVIFSCFKRNIQKDIKVVELAGYVSGTTAYQHGEASLQQTIVGLAQDFVGSNNVNVLEPSGNFGSRLGGGQDAASARYIYTRLSPFARKVFSKQDEPNLQWNEDDGKQIEPQVYCPVVPLLLLNGADGIGTGWSTNIPNYHPGDIVDNLKRRMGRLDTDEEKPFEPMKPWFRGWKGIVEEAGPNRYNVNGIANAVEGKNEVEITELPVRMWTNDFKAKLEDIIKAEKTPSFIKDYKEFNDHKNVHFIIQMDEKHMKASLEEGLNERFKINKTIATSNLVAFDANGMIKKYEKVEDILEDYYVHRMKMYEVRKQSMLDAMEREYRKFTNQARFVKEVIDGKMVISKKKKAVLIAELRKRGYDPIGKVDDVKKAGEEEEFQEDNDDDSETGARDFDYLLGMALWSLTQERVERLLNQMEKKKEEIHELEKLSPKDLWCIDLDDFMATWEAQMDLERSMNQRMKKMGRRLSTKIGAGKVNKKKKDEDGDFSPKAKATSKKVVKVEPKENTAFKNMFKPKAQRMATDGADDSGMSDDDFDAFTAQAQASQSSTSGRSKRAAAAKPKNWLVEDESSGTDDDKFLDDVGDMVKGIGDSATDKPADTGRVSLFSMSRAENGSGARPTSSSATNGIKPRASRVFNTDDSETNYEMLAKPSPLKNVSTVNDTLDDLLKSEGDDDDDDVLPVVKKSTKSAAPKPKKAPVAKKATTKAPAKPMSAAAKAYATKQAKAKGKKAVDDDDDELAMDVDESPKVAPRARSARAAATKVKKPVYIDSDDDEEPSDDDGSVVELDDSD